jgi:hypothetical protein
MMQRTRTWAALTVVLLTGGVISSALADDAPSSRTTQNAESQAADPENLLTRTQAAIGMVEVQIRAAGLVEEHREIAVEVERARGVASTPDGQRRIAALMERKERLAQSVADIEQTIERVAAALSSEEPASRLLGAAGRSMRVNRTESKILYTRFLLQRLPSLDTSPFDDSISAELAELRRLVAEALESLRPTPL